MSKKETQPTTPVNVLHVLEDLGDLDLIEVARMLEREAKEATRRRDAARGAVLRRILDKNAKVLVDDDGVIAAELVARSTYKWDSDGLENALSDNERDQWLKVVPASYAPKNTLSFNNFIAKLGDDPKGVALRNARSVEVSESVKIHGVEND